MAHLHSVYDSDAHFSINPITRALKNEASSKVSVIQYDHNSERFTFEIPRMIEGHDMSLCNEIRVHYINIDSKTKAQLPGVYEVEDMQISPEGDDVVICSWLISRNCTQLVGSLNFLIRFSCVTDGVVDYAWNTATYTGISVASGIDADETFEADYVDVIEQWKASVMREFEAEVAKIADATEAQMETFAEDLKGEVHREIDSGIAVERARIDNLAQVRPYAGATVYEIESSEIPGTIITNGVMANVELTPTLSLTGGSVRDYTIPEYLSPIQSVSTHYPSGDFDLIITISTNTATGQPFIRLRSATGGAFKNITVNLSYTLASLTISEVEDIRVGYDGTTYPNAGDAVRGQTADVQAQIDDVCAKVDAIDSAFDVVWSIGNNILNPSNSVAGSGFTLSPTAGEDVDTFSDGNYMRTETAIPIPAGTKKFYLRTNVKDSNASGYIHLYFLNQDYKYIKKNTTDFKTIIANENGYLTSDTVISSYKYLLVTINGVSKGRSFADLCISTSALDSFEPFSKTETGRTVKPTALPKKVAPTNGMKMLVFGDSITETAKMDNDGGNYSPDFRMNWPVVAQQMLQAGGLRNYAKAGATLRDTGYERNEQGELVPKNDTVLYRMNLSEQVDLATSDENYTDVPDIIVISIGTNDSAAIVANNGRDTYDEAMSIASLEDFNYEARATMHKALRYAMWKLKVAYPDAKCFIATPLQREAFEIPKYTRDAIVAMGNRYGFKVIDAFAESGIIRETCEPRFLPDGLHPSGDAGISMEGVTKQAALYASVILSTYLHEEYL